MSELNVVAVIKAKEGEGDKLAEALKGLAAGTHGEEGNIHYSLHRGLQNTDTFVTIEKWRSMDDLDAHMASSHMQAALAAAGDLFAAPPEIIPLGAIALDDVVKGSF